MAKSPKEKASPEDMEVGVVLYTDGGCKPSRGIGGWGIHGYSYNMNPLEKTNRKIDAITNVGYYDTTDAVVNMRPDGTWSSFKENVVVTAHQPIQYIDGLGSLIPESTNNEAEVIAALKALEVISEIKPTKATLLLDSQYTLKGITEWYPKWEAMGWKRPDGSPTPNADMWKKLIAQHDDVKSYVDLSWGYVRGHSGDLGNDNADRHATRGIILGRKGIAYDSVQISSVAGYNLKPPTYNRLFAFPRWYFVGNTPTDNLTTTGHYGYHLGTRIKRDHLEGKVANDTSFAVLYLKEPQDILDKVREYHNETTPHSYTNVVKGSLDIIFNPYNYDDIARNGCMYLERVGSNLMDCNDRVVTNERDTPHISFRTTGIFAMLEGLLEDFISGAHDKAMCTEVTSEFYEQVTTGKKENCQLRKDFKQSTKARDVLVSCILSGVERQHKVKLTVGLDMPNRNTLVAIASSSPRVFVLTASEGKNAFRAHVVIQTEDDYSIWSSVYSNLIVNLDL